jgi:hypothetical protein
MFTNTNGSSNVAIGRGALYTTDGGQYNVGIGREALYSNTTASNLTAVGYQAGYSTTTSTSGVVIGYKAGYSANGSSLNNSVFVGDSAGYYQTGGANTAIGYNAFLGSTTPANNTGYHNTAVGISALASNTSGTENTSVGYQALYTNATNYRCTALGWKAGYLSTGSENVFIGYRAGQSVNAGSANTLVGPYAGEYQNSITTGSNNVVLGYAGGLAAGTDSHEIFINTVYNASGKGSNTGFINPNGGGVYQGNNSATWSITSDQRLKKNIVDNTVGLSAINAIQVRNFEYRLPEEVTELPQNQAINISGVQLGAIAQELQEILPDCVKTESTGVMSVDTTSITWHLINAVKELSAKVTALENK